MPSELHYLGGRRERIVLVAKQTQERAQRVLVRISARIENFDHPRDRRE